MPYNIRKLQRVDVMGDKDQASQKLVSGASSAAKSHSTGNHSSYDLVSNYSAPSAIYLFGNLLQSWFSSEPRNLSGLTDRIGINDGDIGSNDI